MIYRNIEINIPNYVQHLCLILSYPRSFVNISIIANAQIQCLNFATQKGSLKIAWASQKKAASSIIYSPTLKNLIFVKGHVKLLCNGRKLVYTRFPGDVKRRGIYPAYLALIMYYKYPILYVSTLPSPARCSVSFVTLQ